MPSPIASKGGSGTGAAQSRFFVAGMAPSLFFADGMRFLSAGAGNAGECMYRALIVEDQDLMRLALMAELKENVTDCYLAGAQTFEIATQLLEQEEFNIVIVDPGLPGFDPTSPRDRISVVERIIEASPDAIHIVVTGSDSTSEAEACRRLGAAAYLGKTGLSRGALGDVLQEVSEDGFSLRYSQADSRQPDVNFSGLTPREEQIIGMMMCRKPGMKRRDVYESMGQRFSIDAASAEKYYKQARAKLLKHGQLPRGL
jgi:DNA-binding NarL/FixJ family response regulator